MRLVFTMGFTGPFVPSSFLGTIAALKTPNGHHEHYPLTIQLLRPRQLTGAFEFGISEPPGVYTVLGSSDLANWQQVGIASNGIGGGSFVDVRSQLSSQRFYQALSQNS